MLLLRLAFIRSELLPHVGKLMRRLPFPLFKHSTVCVRDVRETTVACAGAPSPREGPASCGETSETLVA